MVQDYRQPRNYELMTVLIPDLDEEQTNAQVERVQAIVSASGDIAQTMQSSPWGRRRLAYTIRHNGQDYRDGYYLLTYFTAMPDKTAEIERDLKLDAQIMRYLLVQSEPYIAPEEEAGEPEAEVEAEAAATEATEATEAATAGRNEATTASPPEPANEGVEAAPAEEQPGPQEAQAEPAGGPAEETAPEAGETGEGAAGATTEETTEEE